MPTAATDPNDFLPGSIPALIASRLPAHWQHASIDRLHALRRALQSQETAVGRLQAILEQMPPLDQFAKPLVEALAQRAGLGQIDSRATWVRVEQRILLPTAAPVLKPPSYIHISKQTLLAAALHNYHVAETRPDMLRKGQLQDAAGKRLALGFERFAGLCRALNVGGRYQRVLKNLLRPEQDAERSEQVHLAFEAAWRSHAEVAMRLAALDGQLDESCFLHVLPLLSSKPSVAPLPGVVHARQLYLLGKQVRGVLTLEVRDSADGPVRHVIAYFPAQTGQTVTRYASWQALYQDLAVRLRDGDYQRYFARFISERDRATFYSALAPQVQGPATAMQLDGRNLPIEAKIYAYLARQQVDKLFDDARVLAVPTAEEDDDDRRARLDAWQSAGFELLNLAGMFVPVLGEVMLAVNAVQLAGQVYEGYEAWRIGDRATALDHLFSVAENVAIGVLVAKGSSMLRTQLASAPFVDELVPVAAADGRVKLAEAAAAGYVEPQQWASDGQLLRAFGAELSTVSDELATQAMQTTRVTADQLRHLHLAGEGAPARLADAVELHRLHELHVTEQGEALLQRLTGQTDQLSGLEALLQRDFPSLTRRLRQHLTGSAESTHLDSFERTGRVPLVLAERARWLIQDSRLDRACAGLRLARAVNEDTERLALSVLDRLAPPGPERRLELRVGSTEGRLVASIGSGAEVEVLVRVGDGYVLDDGPGPARGLIDALLQSLDDEQQARLGSATSLTGDDLSWRLLGAASENRNQLIETLDMVSPAIGMRAPLRLIDGRLGYPLSGRLGGGRRSIRRGFQRIYPLLTEDELEAYLLDVLEHGESLWDHYQHVQAQLTRLRQALNAWHNAASGIRDSWRRRQVVTALRRAWRRKITNYADEFVVQIDGERVGSLPRLPRGLRFDHIRRLTLRNMDLSEIDEDFLSRFGNLVELDLQGNRLSTVPPGVERLRHLRQLHLGRNRIVMDGAGERRLSALAQLQVLNLSRNPLGYAPALPGLRRLRSLALNGTSLNAVPAQVTWQAHLDLRDNNISQIRMSLTDLRNQIDQMTVHDNPLDAVSEGLLDEASGGVTAGQRGSASYRHGPIDDELLECWLGDGPAATASERRTWWHALHAEQGSSGLFLFLADFARGDDFSEHPGHYRARIWRILKACAEHESVRERLFLQASGTRTCEDRLLLLLGQMEVAVQAEKYTSNLPPAAVPGKLMALARGLYRLDEVDRIAMRHIDQMRAANNPHIDEIEVQLFYRVKLASALDLPIEAETMHYEAFAHVTTRDLIAAQEQVLAAESPQALITSLAQRPFWEAYAREHYAERFAQVNAQSLTLLEASEKELANGTIDEWLFNQRSIGYMHEYQAAERKLLRTLAAELYQRLNP